MSDYKGFIKEKEAIDALLDDGYRIIAVRETLEGDFIEFERHIERKELHLLTADARKYIGTLIVEAKRESKNSCGGTYEEAGAAGS
ncbi:hypothetical protein RRU94_09540 [Domibacillus sp. DTU_2020_1001157_1_SI_ALB_TIR_016]|uniref:hypothetical protein n=1 Tax=Domibacillus sp. DTU_2020_1001157_1_SI_ALB_TIR_016 TaxID=3077789 RepID=UPI0028EBE7A2|nr:hypothetical protein [Domibacillus sp. DTU_2020_1001157_1_SI_ALB_TIR_016]WNS81052.1 hypothetical protein RRU94_09540 [Domibacillus sp. DTU_2020_1001157_1_SI_ALB_TIR_016]